jgi:hypothetical protein
LHLFYQGTGIGEGFIDWQEPCPTGNSGIGVNSIVRK